MVLGVVKKSFLSNSIVRAAPLISSVSDEVRYRRLVAVTTHAANQKEYTVLFLLTGEFIVCVCVCVRVCVCACV